MRAVWSQASVLLPRNLTYHKGSSETNLALRSAFGQSLAVIDSLAALSLLLTSAVDIQSYAITFAVVRTEQSFDYQRQLRDPQAQAAWDQTTHATRCCIFRNTSVKTYAARFSAAGALAARPEQ
jgi:hypothetical protein